MYPQKYSKSLQSVENKFFFFLNKSLDKSLWFYEIKQTSQNCKFILVNIITTANYLVICLFKNKDKLFKPFTTFHIAGWDKFMKNREMF